MGRSPDKAEQIAAGLSEAQRRWLLSALKTPLLDRMKCAWRMKSGRDLGLAVKAWRGGDLLTPLGLAVREILTRSQP